MPAPKEIIFACILVCALLSAAAAQDNSVSAQKSSLTITAAAAGERVRITAPASVVHLHVEVYGVSGEKLFDQEIRGGNVFDWHLQDGQAQRLAPGNYVCVVTAKSISGKLTQKIGAVSVEEKSVSVQPAESKQLSAPQAQTIGPVEENSSWTIAAKDEPQTPTVIANDGIDGQMIRGRGALTFRIGDFFSGNDQEQMRLTEAGNLGLGTSAPKSKLDVAGAIRAERFLVVKPKLGGDQTTDSNALTTDSSNSVQPLIAGSGTLNHIAKWTPDGSTLGDSGIFETNGGLVGIGTPTPTQSLEVANGRILLSGSQTLAAPGGMLEIGTTVTNNANQASGIRMRNTFNGNATNQVALDVAPTFAPSASISLARGFISGAFFAPPPGVTITDAYGGNAVNVYSNTTGAVINGTAFAINSPIPLGSLKPTSQYGLHINNQGIAGTANSYGLYVDAQTGSTNNYSAIFAGGNVGIGTSSPVGNLHVNVPASSNPISALTLDVQSFGTFNNAVGSYYFKARDVGAAGASAFLIRGDGYVGIGTDAPAEKLTVAGVVQSTSGGFKFPDGSVQTSAVGTTYTTYIANFSTLNVTPHSMLQLTSLPSDNYMVTVTLLARNLTNGNRTLSCGFTSDAQAPYHVDIASFAYTTLTLHSVSNISSGSVAINCAVDQGDGITVYDRRLTATKLSAVVVQ